MNQACFINKSKLHLNMQIQSEHEKIKHFRIRKSIITFFSIAFILISLEGYSQTFENNKLFNKKLESANMHFNDNNFHLALPIYNELHAMDSSNTEICYKLGACLFKVRRQTLESLPLFEKAKNEYSEAYYYLGQIYHRKMMFDKALASYMEFKNNGEKPNISIEEVDYLMQKSLVAKEMILTKSNASVTNFNNGINTPYAEYVPLLNPEETKLYFTSRRKGSTGDLLDPYYEYFEDIYVSEKAGTTWNTPTNIGAPLNTETHDACVTLSKDGQQLYIYRTSTDQITGHIFVSQNNEGKWSDPKLFDAHINSENSAESSISIAPDQSTIYFSSNRTGGYGGKDIYRVTKMPDSTWSRPLNLGPTINTPYDEDAPFIHPDGITLYFSSKGNKNMGGYDIFKTTKNENGSIPYIIEQFKWNKWVYVGEVQGIGSPGNHDYSFQITAHSGENKFRVKQVGLGATPKVSAAIVWNFELEKPNYMLTKDHKQIQYSMNTDYEVYDAYGAIVKKGFGKETDIDNLVKGKYYLCFDNQVAEFNKKK